MALGTLRNDVVEVCNGLQDNSELGDEGLPQEGLGDANPLIGSQWCGTLDGLDALVEDVTVAHVMGAEEALQGRAYKCRLFSRSFGTLYWSLSLIVVGSRTLGPWLGPYLSQRECLLRA